MREVTRTLARWRVPLGFVFGVLAVWLARPTWFAWSIGASVAAVGEALRVWAAGHLDKGREVTHTGPYRFIRHPLYLGSTLIGVGMAIASARLPVAFLIAGYLGATLFSAIRTEEAWLRATFGDQYDARFDGRMEPGGRRFSLARAVASREYRAIMGLVVVAALLALKTVFGLQ